MKNFKYCMPDGINTKEEHEQYLKDIGYYKQTNPKDLFKVYKNGEFWDLVDKKHENLFAIGGQAIMIRAGELLNQFFNHKSDANKYLEAKEQDDLVTEFGEWCQLKAFGVNG